MIPRIMKPFMVLLSLTYSTSTHYDPVPLTYISHFIDLINSVLDLHYVIILPNAGAISTSAEFLLFPPLAPKLCKKKNLVSLLIKKYWPNSVFGFSDLSFGFPTRQNTLHKQLGCWLYKMKGSLVKPIVNTIFVPITALASISAHLGNFQPL